MGVRYAKDINFDCHGCKSDGSGGRILFGCERGGHPKFKKLRNDEGFRDSKKCECPFHLKYQQISIGKPEWRLMVMSSVYNHP